MISFVIPAYNEEDIIAETLSLLKEGARGIPHEIILSDDGSTDATVQKASPYADCIAQYHGELPKTIGAARNRGAREARSEIIVFLDGDVRLRKPETFLSKVTRHFASNPKLVAMTVSVRVRPDIETCADRVILSVFDLYFRIANNVFNFGLTHGKCMIVRTDAFKRVGGFNEKMIASEDADLFIRLSKIGKTMLDPSLRVYFTGRRAHTVGWTRLLSQWALNGIWIVVFKRSYSDHWHRVNDPA